PRADARSAWPASPASGPRSLLRECGRLSRRTCGDTTVARNVCATSPGRSVGLPEPGRLHVQYRRVSLRRTWDDREKSVSYTPIHVETIAESIVVPDPVSSTLRGAHLFTHDAPCDVLAMRASFRDARWSQNLHSEVGRTLLMSGG